MNNELKIDETEKLFNVNAVDEKTFKASVIKLVLEELKEKRIIENDETQKKLEELYKNDDRNTKEIFNEIKGLTKEVINQKLNSLKKHETNKVETKITLDNIDEFRNHEKTKNLIKIHYPYPSDEVKIVENHSGYSAKELFEQAKDEKGLVSVGGFVNTCDVSKNFIEPDRINIKLYNVTDLARKGEFVKLSDKEKECVIGLVVSIINQLAKSDEEKKELRDLPVEQVVLKLSKNVFVAPDENIVVLCVPNNPTKDEISAVKKNAQGEYELEDLKMDGNAKTSESGFTSKDKDEKQVESLEKGVSKIKKRKSLWKRAA